MADNKEHEVTDSKANTDGEITLRQRLRDRGRAEVHSLRQSTIKAKAEADYLEMKQKRLERHSEGFESKANFNLGPRTKRFIINLLVVLTLILLMLLINILR